LVGETKPDPAGKESGETKTSNSRKPDLEEDTVGRKGALMSTEQRERANGKEDRDYHSARERPIRLAVRRKKS